MFDMTTYSGPQSLTVPIYGYIMPILGRALEKNSRVIIEYSSHSNVQSNSFFEEIDG